MKQRRHRTQLIPEKIKGEEGGTGHTRILEGYSGRFYTSSGDPIPDSISECTARGINLPPRISAEIAGRESLRQQAQAQLGMAENTQTYQNESAQKSLADLMYEAIGSEAPKQTVRKSRGVHFKAS